jgi:hypothetical protein
MLGLEIELHGCMQGGGQPASPEPDIPALAGAGRSCQQQVRPAAPAGRSPQQLHPLAARHALETQQSRCQFRKVRHPAVLRIHEILAWIRILLFSSLTLKMPKKFFLKPFLLITFESTFTSFFKDKKLKSSHKTVGLRFFLLFLLDDRRIGIHVSD